MNIHDSDADTVALIYHFAMSQILVWVVKIPQNLNEFTQFYFLLNQEILPKISRSSHVLS